MKERYIIFRASPPNEFDTAPFLATCQSVNGYYIQNSEDEEAPLWLEFSTLKEADEFKEKRLNTMNQG